MISTGEREEAAVPGAAVTVGAVGWGSCDSRGLDVKGSAMQRDTKGNSKRKEGSTPGSQKCPVLISALVPTSWEAQGTPLNPYDK